MHLFTARKESLLLICIASSLVITNGFKSLISPSVHGKKFLSTCYQSRYTIKSLVFSKSFNVDQRKRESTACSAASDSMETNDSNKEFLAYTVDQVLDAIANTDKGATASKPLQRKVNAWMEIKSDEYRQSLSALNTQLGRVASSNGIISEVSNNSPAGSLEAPVTVLDDEKIFGNYDVTYVSTLKASKQQGNPAGGNFRGSIGRFIYENDGLYQHIIREDDLTKETDINYSGTKNTNDGKMIELKRRTEDDVIGESSQQVVNNVSREAIVSQIESKKKDKQSRIVVVNYISGKLFRFLTVSVILKGILERITDNDRLSLTAKFGTVLSPGTIRADFDSPLITIGGVGIRIGPNSNVVLDTPYLDDKIRLGMGARGSSFIFKRTLEESANNWKVDIKRKALPAKSAGVFLLFFGTLLINFFPNNNLLFLSLVRNFIAFSSMFVGFILFFTSGGIRVKDNLKLENK